MALEDIKNYLVILDRIATAGQPTESNLREVASNGFNTVINLGLLDPRYCLPDEAGLVRSLAMTYHHIPVDFQAPRQTDLEQFFACMDGASERKIFVHCAANYRVTTFSALYAQARWAWPQGHADRLITKWWQPNDVWTDFIAAARTRLNLH